MDLECCRKVLISAGILNEKFTRAKYATKNYWLITEFGLLKN